MKILYKATRGIPQENLNMIFLQTVGKKNEKKTKKYIRKGCMKHA
jgi:hypothetical protein